MDFPNFYHYNKLQKQRSIHNADLQLASDALMSKRDENITLLWLDENIDKELRDLFEQIHDSVIVSTDQETFLKTINGITDEKILVILSGQCSRSLAPLIHDNKQVYLIYIFCMNKADYEHLSKDLSKVRGIFTEYSHLFEGLQIELRSLVRQMTTFHLFDQKQVSLKDLTRESADFLWYQLLKDVLLAMPETVDSKIEMIDRFRIYYSSKNPTFLTKVDEFEQTYQSCDAICWYTKDSIVYRLVNQALRTEDIEALLAVRYYISDLCTCLKKECEKLKVQGLDVLTVYRGQFLPTEDIDKLQQSVGQLISANGFLSTTRSLIVAEIYAGPGNVIFEYVIDTHLNQNIIFADISEHSEMPHEEEVLFDLGTIFRVEKVYFDKSSGFWKVNLVAADETENLTNNFMRQRRDRMRMPSIELEFGFLLIEMGQYSKAISYFDNLIQQHQNDDIFKLNCYYSLAFSYSGNHQNVKAMQYATFAYKRCIELSSNTDKGDRMLSRLFDLLGSIHLERGETELASKYYYQSMNINPSDADNPEILALYHRTNAYICFSQGNYTQALDHFQKRLTIYEKWTTYDDRALAESHSSLGRTYLEIKHYEQAFEHLQITLELYKKSLPTHHSALSSTYRDLANICHCTKKYDLALEYYLKAEESAPTLKKFTDNSVLLSAHLCSLAGNCYLHKNENTLAEQYFRTSLALYEKCRSSVKGENLLIDIQWNMGVVFSRKREFYSALEHYKESLVLVERIMPDERIRIAELNDGIGVCYENIGQYDLCIEHAQKSLEIYEQCIPPDVEKLTDMHNTVARCYCMKHEYLLAIKHRKQSLFLEEQKVPRNVAQIAGLHTSIGWSYHLNGDYNSAIDYCIKSLHIFEKHELNDHVEYGNVLSTLGVIYFKMKDFERAFKFCSKSMEMI
ncbi:unnamed protein product [Rotaria sp. Silwood1]|nr:unnamed protein product [Rotaria sp. Silwood1]